MLPKIFTDLRVRMLRLFFVFIGFITLQAEEYPRRFEGKFEQWESKKFALIALFLPPDPVILHAGAHYGEETKELALCWPFGKVMGFEPNPRAFGFSLTNTAFLKNLELYPYALYDREGIEPFYICHGTGGDSYDFEHSSSLLWPSEAMAWHYRGPTIHVECVTLDEWCASKEIEHVDFLRLDLQGAELQALKEAYKILKTIKVIHVETNFFLFRIGTTLYPELREFLEEVGFTLLSHWYREGLTGSAIFINNHFYH